MRHRARTDANHSAVRAALRKLGCEVLDLSSVGGGCPDLLVLVRTGRRAGSLHLIEVKDGSKSPSRRRLTIDQIESQGKWPVHVIDNIHQVLELCGAT